MTIAHTITISDGRGRAAGRALLLPEASTTAEALYKALRDMPSETGGWWAHASFRAGIAPDKNGIPTERPDHYRHGDLWHSSIALVGDCDRVRHLAWTDETIAVIRRAISSWAIPGSVFEVTPHGLRSMFPLSEPTEDAALWERAARGMCALLDTALAKIPEAGLEIDTGASCDRARYFWAPRATVSKKPDSDCSCPYCLGSPRAGELYLVRAQDWTLEELAAHAAPHSERKEQAGPDADGKVRHPGRHVFLKREAASLRGRGYRGTALLRRLLAADLSECEPPLQTVGRRQEIERLADDFTNKDGKDAPGGDKDPPDPERFIRVAMGAPDFVEKQYPKPQNLVGDGILCAGDLGIFYGRPGSGKTWAALQLAVALVRGEPWFGLPTGNGKACRVGILELELHAFRIQERLKTMKVDGRDAALRLVSRPDLAGRVDLMSDSDLQALERWCRDEGLDLLFLDALSRIHQADENRDMGKVLGNLDAVRHATGTALKLIHHEPKATSGQGKKIDDLDALRGDSRLQSDPTCLMRLVKLNGGLRTLRFVKVNNAQEPEPIWLRQLDNGTLEVTDAPEKQAAKGAANRKKVSDALVEHATTGGVTAEQICELVGLKTSTVHDHLKALGARMVQSGRETPRYLPPVDGKEARP